MKIRINILTEKNTVDKLKKYCKKNETSISQITRDFWKDLLKNESK